MREIKFRVWLKEENRWGDNSALEVFKSSGQLEYLCDTNVEIQEFSGLKDKTNKEVYEGDILRFYKGRPYQAEYEVYWHICGFSLISAKRDGDKYGVFTKRLDTLMPADEFEIIGNIFENPELLK